MATRGQIKARVKDHIIDLPSETDAEIDGWINYAIRFAMSLHNFRVMEALAPYTTASGNAITSDRVLGVKPVDWKEARADPWLLDGLGGTREISWLTSESEAVRLFSEEDDDDRGAPLAILEEQSGFKVYPASDGNSLHDDGEYRVKLPYWKYLPALEDDPDTNWFTDNAEDYVVWKAASEGMLFNREEERASLWAIKAGTFDERTGRFTGELRRIVRVDKRSRIPRRATIGVSLDVYGPVRGRF